MSDDIRLSRDDLLAMRQGLLLQVDAIENTLDIQPRTKRLRKDVKEEEKNKADICHCEIPEPYDNNPDLCSRCISHIRH